MSLLRRLVPVVVAGGLLAGCGTGSGGSGAVSLKAERALKPYVEAVRQAAASKSRTALENAVRQLKHEVRVEQNGISTSRQAEIDNAADAVLNDLSPTASPTHSPTSSPSSSPTPTQTPTPTPTVTVTPTHTVTVTPTAPPTSPPAGPTPPGQTKTPPGQTKTPPGPAKKGKQGPAGTAGPTPPGG